MANVWGTVTAISPLRVKLDGDTTAIPVAPDSLIDSAKLVVSDRVRLELSNNSLIVTGKSGGLASSSGSPAGSILAWVSNTIPSNYAEANGQALSRSTYSDLFAICGIEFGAGDGSTTFNVPNLSGRVIVASDVSQLDFDSLGKTGGAKTHTLTVAEMPSHKHALGPNTGGNVGYSEAGGPNLYTVGFGATRGGIGTPDLTAGQTGGGGSHNNLQPYMALKYIIKLSGGIGVLDNTIESVLIDRMGVVETIQQRQPRGVIPSSVVVGSGSASVAADGTITFTGASSVSLNGVFDGLGGDMYRITIENRDSSASNSLSVRLRASGTDNSSAIYDSQLTFGNGSTTSSGRYIGQTSYPLGSGSRDRNGATLDVLSPARAQETLVKSDTWQSNNDGNGSLLSIRGGFASVGTVFDGITLLGTASNFTGTMKVVKI
jgi:microcystin-dependent protein